MEQALTKALVDAGVGTLIALLVLGGLYRMAGRLGGKFIEAQQSQAEALGAQAQSMEGLTRRLGDYVTRDNSEHREMLVLLRYMAQQQKSFEEVRVEHNERKEQAHPSCPAKAS
jgi:DNA-binding MarR family transcriptional regulator